MTIGAVTGAGALMSGSLYCMLYTPWSLRQSDAEAVCPIIHCLCVKPRDADRDGVCAGQDNGEEQPDEESMVPEPDAPADPGTVMVEPRHTHAAAC